MKLDLTDQKTFLPARKIQLGLSTDSEIHRLLSKDAVKRDDVLRFRDESLKFVTTTAVKIRSMNPMSTSVIRNAVALNPTVMMKNDADVLRRKFKYLVQILASSGIVTCEEGDQAMCEYRDMLVTLEGVTYDRSSCTLDQFFFVTIDLNKYAAISDIVKCVLTFGHGQAAIERGFSVNKSLLQDNMSEEYIVSRRLIKDHKCVKKLTPPL